MAARLELHLLGRPRILVDGQPVTDSLPLKAQALLAYLLVTGEAHDRHALAGLLWGGVPDDKANNSLRVALTRLRQVCPEHLAVTHLTVAFDPAQGAWSDLAEFEQRVQALPARGPAGWRDALSLYRGDFLTGFFIEDAPEFEAWLLAQRAHWQQLALRALDQASTALLARRAHAEAAEALRRRLALEPWHEPSHQQLMQALSRLGDFNGALAQYEACRRVLAEELAAEPMPATIALYERIQVARAAPPPPLPPDPSPLVGRAAELEQILLLLANPACRLLTIVGLGGSGKTRLALAAARQANQEQALLFLNGVALAALAGTPSAESLPRALAEAAGQTDPATGLADFLRNKEMLLVLDNFEPLLAPSAGEAARELLSHLLSACPHLKLLVTSREPLRLAAEWRFDLDGLAYPRSAEEAQPPAVWAYAAAQLFAQVAERVRPGRPLAEADAAHVGELCRLTAGSPLALMLAAHWLRVMPVAAIAAEVAANLDLLAADLHDVPPRQRSLRAVLDETWALCSAEEQRALETLSVFQGSFTAEAARAVAGAPLGLLAGLVERDLLQSGPSEGRYFLHELTRQYAAGKFLARPGGALDGEAALAEHFAGLLEQQAPSLHTDRQAAAYGRLRAESGSLRQAWQWAVAQRRWDLVERLLEGLFEFLSGQSAWLEGEALCARAVEALRAEPAPAGRLLVRLLARWAEFLRALGRHEQAGAQLRQAQALAEQFGEDPLLALTWQGLAEADYAQGRYPSAAAAAEQALQAYEQLGDQRAIAQVSALLGRVSGIAGRYAQAAAHLQRSRAIFQAAGDRLGQVRVLRSLGVDALNLGHYAEAEAYTLEALDHLRQLGLERTGHILLNNLGSIAWARGDREQARERYAACLALSQALGDRNGEALAWAGLCLAARGAGDLVEAWRCAQRSLDISQDLGDQNRIAWAWKILGEAERDLRHFDSARQKLETSLAIYQEIGHQDSAAHVMGLLAALARDGGEAAAAQRYALQSLRLAQAMGSEAAALEALVNVAGSQALAGEWSRAAALLYLASQHPAVSQAARAEADRLLAQAQDYLGPEGLTAAQAQAQALRLWPLAAELLSA